MAESDALDLSPAQTAAAEPQIQRATEQRLPGADLKVQRDGYFDVDIDIDIDIDIGFGIADVLEMIPGYDMLTLIIGSDPITGDTVDRSPAAVLGAIVGLLPGGKAVYDEVSRLEVIQSAFDLIDSQLDDSDLTLTRLSRTIDQAWAEVEVVEGIDFNVNVVTRHVDQLLDDAERFADGVTTAVIDIIKGAAIDEAERLLAASDTASAAWELTKSVLHSDPLRGTVVEATTEHIIEQFLLLIGKEQELEKMKEQGTLTETAEWIDTQLDTFQSIVGDFGTLVDDAFAALSIAELPNLAQNLIDLADRGLALIDRVTDFATTVATKVLELIKDSFLEMLDGHAQGVPGFNLMTVLLAENPFTRATVARSPENLIKGFITLLPGGEAKYDELSASGVIPDAAARINAAIDELGISWEFVEGLFNDIWNSFTIEDLVAPFEAFERVVAQFSEPISRLFAFIRTVSETVFTLILELMEFPTELLQRIIANAIAAFGDIERDPVGFLSNMIDALKLGFQHFFENIGDHLLSGLSDWLLGGLADAGIEIPDELTLESILDVVFQVLDLSEDTFWEKLTARIGEEKVAKIRGGIDQVTGLVDQAGDIWNVITDIKERGLVVIWEYIEEKISGLWDTIIGKAQDWIMTEMIEAAIAKVVSMLDPTGVMAVVNSFLAFIRAVQSVIEYAREILEIVDRYVSTIASIAAGDVEPGAQQLEAGLASGIPVAIGFLANQIGLGDIAEKIVEIIQGIREVVDEALDWLIGKLVDAGESVLASLGIGDDTDADSPDAEDSDLDMSDHDRVATTVVNELTAVRGANDYEGLRQAMETRARELERRYTPRLDGDVTLRVTFSDQTADQEDQDIDFRVLIAPNDTDITGSKQFGDGDGITGHSPSIGIAASYQANKSSVRAGHDHRSGAQREAGHHDLVAEHVIPRSVVDKASIAMGGTGVPRTSPFDDQMRTIIIYARAASGKTRSDPNFTADSRRLAAQADEREPSRRVARVGLQKDLLLNAIDGIRQSTAATTAREVGADNDGAGGSGRGTAGNAKPTQRDIEAASDAQFNQIDEYLTGEVEGVLQTEEDLEELGHTGFNVCREIAQRFGGSQESDGGAGRDYLTRVNLGRDGGTDTRRGPADLSFDTSASTWKLRLGNRQGIDPVYQGKTYASGPISDESVSTISSAINELRSGVADGEGEATSSSRYDDALRTRALELFLRGKEANLSNNAAAVAARDQLQGLDEDKPSTTSIVRWAVDANADESSSAPPH